jgi:hypothetical protein
MIRVGQSYYFLLCNQGICYLPPKVHRDVCTMVLWASSYVQPTSAALGLSAKTYGYTYSQLPKRIKRTFTLIVYVQTAEIFARGKKIHNTTIKVVALQRWRAFRTNPISNSAV